MTRRSVILVCNLIFIVGTLTVLLSLSRPQDGVFPLRRALSVLKRHSDPKSIQPKFFTDLSLKYSGLRFLFFGTSRTFGAFLEDRETHSFPSLVAPKNGVNLGVPGGTCPYPATCAHTMLDPVEKGDSFDVVVLEFDTDGFFVAHLARRMRERYPHAYIILVEMWKMVFYRNIRDGKPVLQWLQDKGFGKLSGPGKIGPSFSEFIYKNSSPEDWQYGDPGFDPDIYTQLEDLGVKVVRSRVPQNLHEALFHTNVFLADLHHYTVIGHYHVASLILRHLDQVGIRTEHDGVLGPWDDRDQCENWFRNGFTNLTYDTANIEMNEFAPAKHALEIRASEAWIKVFNPDDHDKRLSLDIMLAQPDCKYPLVEISLLGSKAAPVTTECPATSQYVWQVNVQTRIIVGRVRPGENVVRIRALEENKEWPFRITGVALTKYSLAI